MNRPAAVLLVLLPSVLACSSMYEPARSPRITTVVVDGTPTFVKDGKRYGGAAFATGLVDAVQGNPRAEEEARAGRNYAIAGFVLDLTGVAAETGGLVVIGENDRHLNTGLGLLVGGLACVAIGSGLLLSAPPHIYDAVNIYNDGVDRAGGSPIPAAR